MKLGEIELAAGNHFVAMQFYGLILNRTYLVLLTDNKLIGVVANGIVSEKSFSQGPVADAIIDRLVIAGDRENPLSYLSEKYLAKVRDLDLLTDDLSRAHRANFRYGCGEIASVEFDPHKKWGMGSYPHSGKLYIGVGGKRREFILMGKQSGPDIAERVRQLSGNR